MDEIKKQIIDSCVTELCKNENQNKITQSIIDPITKHIYKKFQFLFIIIALFMIILYQK